MSEAIAKQVPKESPNGFCEGIVGKHLILLGNQLSCCTATSRRQSRICAAASPSCRYKNTAAVLTAEHSWRSALGSASKSINLLINTCFLTLVLKLLSV